MAVGFAVCHHSVQSEMRVEIEFCSRVGLGAWLDVLQSIEQ